MNDYKTLLMAVDLSDESAQVAARARALASASGATLHIIHVIEPLSFAYGGDIPMDFSGIQDEIQVQAKQQLERFAANHDIPAERQHIVLGRPEVKIHSTAEDIGADLIVVGSHGRYGLALLMGSTANGVLHGATCDVLAVRVGIEKAAPKKDPETLREEFAAAVDAAIKECSTLGYTPNFLIDMLTKQHAVEVAKKLIMKGPTDGLKRIAQLKQAHLALESIMLREEFAPLFAQDELKTARWNLEQVGL